MADPSTSKTSRTASCSCRKLTCRPPAQGGRRARRRARLAERRPDPSAIGINIPAPTRLRGRPCAGGRRVFRSWRHRRGDRAQLLAVAATASSPEAHRRAHLSPHGRRLPRRPPRAPPGATEDDGDDGPRGGAPRAFRAGEPHRHRAPRGRCTHRRQREAGGGRPAAAGVLPATCRIGDAAHAAWWATVGLLQRGEFGTLTAAQKRAVTAMDGVARAPAQHHRLLLDGDPSSDRAHAFASRPLRLPPPSPAAAIDPAAPPSSRKNPPARHDVPGAPDRRRGRRDHLGRAMGHPFDNAQKFTPGRAAPSRWRCAVERALCELPRGLRAPASPPRWLSRIRTFVQVDGFAHPPARRRRRRARGGSTASPGSHRRRHRQPPPASPSRVSAPGFSSAWSPAPCAPASDRRGLPSTSTTTPAAVCTAARATRRSISPRPVRQPLQRPLDDRRLRHILKTPASPLARAAGSAPRELVFTPPAGREAVHSRFARRSARRSRDERGATGRTLPARPASPRRVAPQSPIQVDPADTVGEGLPDVAEDSPARSHAGRVGGGRSLAVQHETGAIYDCQPRCSDAARDAEATLVVDAGAGARRARSRSRPRRASGPRRSRCRPKDWQPARRRALCPRGRARVAQQVTRRRQGAARPRGQPRTSGAVGFSAAASVLPHRGNGSRRCLAAAARRDRIRSLAQHARCQV